ncbi:MAG: hypothetical protein J6K69_00645 [Candidatus Methanomethylophilaceae archaeon]|nr:hypothetical protein [Candidatus Methanomethylophilaceae archaeon]MBQ8643565.1 hypothetical protein [Candidatus Methanomethylophilaceae archaeon]MBR2348599.1 hypothetical protein [Candidatus Methanomethylophilaceae archaeon]
MTNENYRKCRTCRYCRHAGESWVCTIENVPTDNDSTCDRYRPGSCGNCNHYSSGTCTVTGAEVMDLEVCDRYDPSGPV